jgi:hypothetical protein
MGRIKDAFKKMASLGRSKKAAKGHPLQADGYAGARPNPIIPALMPRGLRDIRDAKKGWRITRHICVERSSRLPSLTIRAGAKRRAVRKAARKAVQLSRRRNHAA